MGRAWKAVLTLAVLAAHTRSEEDAEEMPPEDDEGFEQGDKIGMKHLMQDALNHEQMHGIHKKIDYNADGKVSMAEVMKFSEDMRKVIASKDIKTVLDEMDTDKDGKLALNELLKDMDQWGEGSEEDKKEAQLRKDLETEKFEVADADKNGLLDEQELPALFYPETHDGVLELTARATLKAKDKNGDGLLTPAEFWEGDTVDSEELSISEEEQKDFRNLDKDGSGKLDLQELKVWESGQFHTQEAMKKLFDLADKDSDMHVTAEELSGAREQIAGSDAQYHLMEWAEHHEL